MQNPPTKRSKPVTKPSTTPVEPAGESPVDFKKGRREKATLVDPIKDTKPPHSVEAEQGVLGCIMLEPAKCIGVCIEKINGGPEAFYDLRHRTIYELMVEMYSKKEAIDLITIQQKLKDRGQLEGVGGLVYIASLPDCVPSAANLDYYIEILREKHVMRVMIGTCTDAVSGAYEHHGEVDVLIDKVVVDIQKVADLAVSKESVYPVKKLVPEALAHIEKLLAGGTISIPTGFTDLDEITWGLHPGEMFVLAARPSVGKTALAMNIAEHLSLNGQSVGVFSLEMTKESLMQRLLCARAKVNHHHIRKGMLSAEETNRLMKAASELAKAKLVIDDTGGLSLIKLQARARRMKQQYGISVLVIDYLQLMNAKVRQSDNRQVEVSAISSGIKAIGKELNVPVVVLSQLSRKSEDRGNNSEPKLSDLRESGSIEQDADTVLLMYREKSKVKEEGGSQTVQITPVKVNVAKNRNGPIGEIELMFLKYCTRFENAAPIDSGEHGHETPDFI